ncbi:MAG: hypothetical protein LC795_21775 [Acidobacteria bacterium]|nr:hypothetical protein [Acidobacteriota bacterium]
MNYKSNSHSLNFGLPRRGAAVIFFAIFFLLTSQGAAAQTQLTEEASKQLRAQAEESSRAFMEGNYERLADFTHPKVVELMGGREKMAEFVRKSMAGVKSQGFETLSYAPAAEPTQVLREGGQFYAILPAKLRMRTPDGVIFVSESFMIAVSADDGKNWKFVSGATADAAKLKLLMPEVADKLKLPTVRNYPEPEKKP